MALHKNHPDLEDDISSHDLQVKYPRPISEPPSPHSSRASTPAASVRGSDSEESEEENNFQERYQARKQFISTNGIAEHIRELKLNQWKNF